MVQTKKKNQGPDETQTVIPINAIEFAKEKEEPTEKEKGGLSYDLSKMKLSDNVRNIMKKKTMMTVTNKAQKRMTYHKKYFTKKGETKDLIPKTEKGEREIGGLLLGLSENAAEPTRNVREIMTTTTNKTHKKIIHCDKHFIKQKQIKNLMKKRKNLPGSQTGTANLISQEASTQVKVSAAL